MSTLPPKHIHIHICVLQESKANRRFTEKSGWMCSGGSVRTTRSRPFIAVHFFVTKHRHSGSDIRNFPKLKQVKRGSSSTSQKCGLPGFHENQYSQQELSMCSKRSPRIGQGHMSCALVKLCQRVLKSQECLSRLGTGGLCSSHPIG